MTSPWSSYNSGTNNFSARRLGYDEIRNAEPTAIIDPNELEMRECVGRGSFGDVYRAYWRHAEVAVKKIPTLNDDLYAELFREAKLMLYAARYLY